MDNKQNNKTNLVLCPECDTPLAIGEIKVGKIVECPACGIESEIVSLVPLKLSPLEEEK